eukprot:5703401-Pyramimonas_sp.AAC.1
MVLDRSSRAWGKRLRTHDAFCYDATCMSPRVCQTLVVSYRLSHFCRPVGGPRGQTSWGPRENRKGPAETAGSCARLQNYNVQTPILGFGT